MIKTTSGIEHEGYFIPLSKFSQADKETIMQSVELRSLRGYAARNGLDIVIAEEAEIKAKMSDLRARIQPSMGLFKIK